MIDARIPLGIQQFSLADIAQQAEQLKASRQQREYRQFEMDSRKQDMVDRKTLSSLLPKAVQGDKAAMQQVAGVGSEDAMEWYIKLDDRSRAAEKEKVKDMVQATRWAETPEQWEQVKGYYRTKGVQVPDLPFQQREQVMMELGQIGAYMDSAPKMELKTTEPGGGLYGVDPRTGATKVLVQPNAGDAQFGQPAAGAKTINGVTYYPLPGGKWTTDAPGGQPGGSGPFVQ